MVDTTQTVKIGFDVPEGMDLPSETLTRMKRWIIAGLVTLQESEGFDKYMTSVWGGRSVRS